MTTRREFLDRVSAPFLLSAVGVPFRMDEELVSRLAALRQDPRPAGEIAGDEAFWGSIARAFTVDRSIVNLNNGGVSPSPTWVQDAMKHHLDFSNKAPAWTMWQILEPQREGVRQRIAREWGVDPEEIAFTRNASEGLQILQFGIDLAPGDELLTTTQDYPRMLTTFRQRERREGVVLRSIELPVPAEDDAEVVRRFEEAITPRTRVILLCHMINLTGQILPVRDVVRMARRHGIPVLVDGAHALAHFDFRLPELECDYYATSLHKWLFAPHGTGLLYIRRERIPGIWPLMAAEASADGDIRKFEEIGTHPAANTLAIAEALTFHQAIGSARKEARLVLLRDRWAHRLLAASDRIRLHTSLRPGRACGIANVQIEGIDSRALGSHLWNRHRIFTTPILHAQFEGLRISPSVYTTLEEIDRFGDAMEAVLRDGLPA